MADQNALPARRRAKVPDCPQAPGDFNMKKLAVLQAALDTCRDDAVRQALHRVLPSFHTPEEINRNAEAAEEMRAARQSGTNA